jgi:hypothetical protein
MLIYVLNYLLFETSKLEEANNSAFSKVLFY